MHVKSHTPNAIKCLFREVQKTNCFCQNPYGEVYFKFDRGGAINLQTGRIEIFLPEDVVYSVKCELVLE